MAGASSSSPRSGQKARRNISARREGGQTPIFRRLPKFGFKAISPKVVAIVNLDKLGRFDAGATVDPETLTGARLVNGRFDAIRILGQGALDKALTVRAHAFSKSAKAAIEKAGGKAEVIASAAPAADAPTAQS